jgi:dynein assembly factor 3
MDGFGNINWWGFSPSVDLLSIFDEKCEKLANNDSSQVKEINILLMNSGDSRHILKILASKHRSSIKNLKINFYVYEKMLELYARHFLLLSIALEHPAKMSIQEKTELFLEIYGNLLIREYSAQHVIKRANEFIKYITDLDFMTKTNLGIFDFSLLKFKERDFLEGIFKFWRMKLCQEKKEEDPNFPASKCWDVRLRSYFGTRYDNRRNAYDWDFQMKFIDRKNCAIINNKIYSGWRDSGVAYELRDSSYDTPNKTLASGFVFNDPRNGDKTSRRGYFGDIIVGPFLAFGIDSENKDFYKKQNESYRYTAWDIARSNLNSLMLSLLKTSGLNLKKYRVDEAENISAKITELKLEEINKVEGDDKQETDTPIEDFFKLENCKITFLTLTALQDFTQKSKYENFFDIIYLANSAVTYMNDSKLKKLLKTNQKSLVLFETAKFMLELKNEQINGFSERVKEIAKENELIDVNDYSSSSKEPDTPSKDTNSDQRKKVSIEFLDHLVFTSQK